MPSGQRGARRRWAGFVAAAAGALSAALIVALLAPRFFEDIALYRRGCVRVRAELVDFKIYAMHDDYADGRFEAWDGLVFKVRSPERWAGRSRTVLCHFTDLLESRSPFLRKGGVFEFTVPTSFMDTGGRLSDNAYVTRYVYISAMSDVKALKPGE